MALRASKTKKITVPGPPPPGNRLCVPLIPQDQKQWCWAACAEMILKYYKENRIGQCDLANLAFADAGGGCCNTPSSSLCDKKLSDSRIRQLFDTKAVNIHHHYTAGSVPFATVRGEIDNYRPIQIGITLRGGGHVVIVQGWTLTQMGEYLIVNDPGSGGSQGPVSFSDLQTANSLRTWDATWTELTR
jgi:hypothetical protein